MNTSMRIFFGALFAVFFITVPTVADAAILKLSPVRVEVKAGGTVTLTLTIDTELEKVNAAEAQISYPADIIEFVSADRNGSPFGYWVEEPNAKDGVVRFLAGTTESVDDRAVLVFKATFRAVKDGVAELAIGNGVVTRDDGEGTNVLRSTQDATVIVGAGAAALPPELPQRVTRPPVAATGLPAAPVLRIPFYPETGKWHNQTGKFTVFWNIPPDVAAVATVIDKRPSTVPASFDSELFTGEQFDALSEGTWYLHVRFRNNVGEGPTTHYRIGIDKTPPAAFSITTAGAAKDASGQLILETDNPQPTLSFQSRDALSGLSYYLIAVPGEAELRTDKTEFKLPILAPGDRVVTVTAVDNAGNTQNSTVRIVTIPIESPTITYVQKEAYVGEGFLLVRGTARPGFQANVSVKDEACEVSGRAISSVSKEGNWEAVIREPLQKKTYHIEAVSQDSRGATSLAVSSESFKVKAKPLLVLFGIPIGATVFYVTIIILLIGAFAGGLWFEKKLSEERSRDLFIARRDIINAFQNVGKEIDAIMQKYADEKIDERELLEIKTMLTRLKEGTAKTAKYIGEYVSEIRK